MATGKSKQSAKQPTPRKSHESDRPLKESAAAKESDKAPGGQPPASSPVTSPPHGQYPPPTELPPTTTSNDPPVTNNEDDPEGEIEEDEDGLFTLETMDNRSLELAGDTARQVEKFLQGNKAWSFFIDKSRKPVELSVTTAAGQCRRWVGGFPIPE